MENKGLVSVIIPVYNVEEYLEECIESVLCQSYPYYEVILIDDGSTDSSGTICDKYAKLDTRIQVIHQKNQGLSITRNNGVKKAKGKYVYFLDSDDWIIEEALYKLVSVADSIDADVIFFDAYSFIDEYPNKSIKQRYLRKNKYGITSGFQLLENLQNNKEYHSAVQLSFLKREFIERKKITFEPGVIYEDMLYTYIVLCKAEKATVLNESLYHRRYRENSIMTSKKTIRNFLSAKHIFSKVLEFSKEIDIDKNEVSRAYISRCAFNAMNYYTALDKKEKKISKEEYKELKKIILKDNAYDNKALYMRCYGTLPWFIYKCLEKIFITGMKG